MRLDGWRHSDHRRLHAGAGDGSRGYGKGSWPATGACSDCSCRCWRWIWHKLDVSLQPLLGLAALKTGRGPAAWSTRHESMTSTIKRHPAKMQGRLSADRDGTITGMIFEGDFNTGAYASWGPTVATRSNTRVWSISCATLFCRGQRNSHQRAGRRRVSRFWVPQAALLQEKLMDRLADAVGLDRLPNP